MDKVEPTPEHSTRDYLGRWRKGVSGNAGGRPSGSGHIGALRSRLKENIEAVVDVIYRQAMSGDTRSASLLLERCFPPLRSVDEPVAFEMPDGPLRHP